MAKPPWYVIDAGVDDEDSVIVRGTGKGDVVLGVVNFGSFTGRLTIVAGTSLDDLITALRSAAKYTHEREAK